MNRDATRLRDVATGQRLGPLGLVVSAEANERYWRAAGIEHPSLEAGALYPPIAANLTVLLLQTVVDEPVLGRSDGSAFGLGLCGLLLLISAVRRHRSGS